MADELKNCEIEDDDLDGAAGGAITGEDIENYIVESSSLGRCSICGYPLSNPSSIVSHFKSAHV